MIDSDGYKLVRPSFRAFPYIFLTRKDVFAKSYILFEELLSKLILFVCYFNRICDFRGLLCLFLSGKSWDHGAGVTLVQHIVHLPCMPLTWV